MNSNVRFPDDEIVINIDGQIDLSILKLNASKNTTTTTTTTNSTTATTTQQQIISRTIDLSFRLLLLQHQKYNMWRTRAKILSPNHKIHQLLLQSVSSSSVTSATGTPNPAVNNNNANNSNNINSSNINNPNTSNIPNNNTSNTTAAAAAAASAPAVGNTMVGTNNASVPINNSNSAPVIPAATPTPMTAAVAGTSSASSVQRARTKLASHNQLTRDLPKEISILLPIMSLTRFWVQFDRIRHVVHSIISPLSGGLSISVHFKFADYLTSYLNQSNITYNAYPGYTETALSLGISILKG